MVQPIPGDMRLRITIPDYDFRIMNFDSVRKSVWKCRVNKSLLTRKYSLLVHKLTESKFVIRKSKSGIVILLSPGIGYSLFG